VFFFFYIKQRSFSLPFEEFFTSIKITFFMSGKKRHLFHLVNPSPWPFIVSLSVFLFASGFGFYMHRIQFGGLVCLLGLISLLISVSLWFRDIIEEASYVGHHTQVVRRGLILGFYFFIASEVMLFFGFF